LNGKVYGTDKGHNTLQQPFSILLSQSAISALKRDDPVRAFDTSTELGVLGVELASRGFGQSAADVTRQIYSYASTCIDQRFANDPPDLLKSTSRYFV
jgi:hypothetical protein